MTNNSLPENCRSWNDVQDELFGAPGTPLRDQLEKESELFRLSERLKLARKEAGMTQQELAEKVGIKRYDLSLIERGKVNIGIVTLFDLFRALGKQISFTIM